MNVHIMQWYTVQLGGCNSRKSYTIVYSVAERIEFLLMLYKSLQRS
jgi:hypothetical protein